MQDSEKSLTLTPSHRYYIWYYVGGILLLPIGLGLLLIWVAWRRLNSLSYIITDQSISIKEGHYEQALNLSDIRKTSVIRSPMQARLGIGNILLKTNRSTLLLEGLPNPETLLEKIDLAIEFETKRNKAARMPTPAIPAYDPGTMDRMDTLTGLWQQGLISDEDYREERKKFER